MGGNDSICFHPLQRGKESHEVSDRRYGILPYCNNFLSVLIIPVVSFFRPIFGVGSSITLMFQAFVCARIGMDYCRTDRDKMIAGVMAAVLATQGTAWASAWALAVGFGLNIFLSNWDPRKKEENAIEDKN